MTNVGTKKHNPKLDIDEKSYANQLINEKSFLSTNTLMSVEFIAFHVIASKDKSVLEFFVYVFIHHRVDFFRQKLVIWLSFDTFSSE